MIPNLKIFEETITEVTYQTKTYKIHIYEETPTDEDILSNVLGSFVLGKSTLGGGYYDR